MSITSPGSLKKNRRQPVIEEHPAFFCWHPFFRATSKKPYGGLMSTCDDSPHRPFINHPSSFDPQPLHEKLWNGPHIRAADVMLHQVFSLVCVRQMRRDRPSAAAHTMPPGGSGVSLSRCMSWRVTHSSHVQAVGSHVQAVGFHVQAVGSSYQTDDLIGAFCPDGTGAISRGQPTEGRQPGTGCPKEALI